jgi:hypothetical protein
MLVSMEANNPKFLREEVENVFTEMDKDKDEALSLGDIQACAEQAGMQISDEAINEILRESDINQNGKVDAKDFALLMEQAWERTHELTIKERLNVQEDIAAKQAQLEALLVKMRKSTGEVEPEEGFEPLTEEEQAQGKKDMKQWNDELELANIVRSLPRTAEGPEKEAMREREVPWPHLLHPPPGHTSL